MADPKLIVAEPGVESPERYVRRVHVLAAVYFGLFGLSLAGLVLVIWKGEFFVTLSQRSNVETLVIAFFVIFFVYIGFLSSGGAWGAANVAYYAVLGRIAGAETAERRKMSRLPGPPEQAPVVALNQALDVARSPAKSFEVPVRDEFGSLGVIRVEGARLTHLQEHEQPANNLLAFFVHQVAAVLRDRGVQVNLDVVNWKVIDDEGTEQYLSLVQFARNLEQHLGAEHLWPTVTVTRADLQEIERRLSTICPALRSEAFLPDWEYQAEHKLPIIPEPLGLASLSRSERRADPVVSMGLSLAVVAVAVGIFGLLVVFPPWVPGS